MRANRMTNMYSNLIRVEYFTFNRAQSLSRISPQKYFFDTAFRPEFLNFVRKFWKLRKNI